MPKRLVLLLLFILFTVSVLSRPKSILAAADCANTINYYTDFAVVPQNQQQITMHFEGLNPGTYRLRFGCNWNLLDNCNLKGETFTQQVTTSTDKLDLIIDSSAGKLDLQKHTATLEFMKSSNNWDEYCGNVKYDVGYDYTTCKLTYSPPNPTELETITVNVSQAPTGEFPIYSERQEVGSIRIDVNGNGSTTINPSQRPIQGSLELLSDKIPNAKTQIMCKTNITILPARGTTPRPTQPPVPTQPNVRNGPNGAAGCTGTKCSSSAGISCLVKDGTPIKSSQGLDPKDVGIMTAIGCVPTEPKALIAGLFRIGIGAGGGIAFLLMIAGVFQMITSAGNPEGVKKGSEQITSAVIGLLFIIFSVMLLQVIGVDILQIPGFTR